MKTKLIDLKIILISLLVLFLFPLEGKTQSSATRRAVARAFRSCIDIQQFPPMGTTNWMQYWSIAWAKTVCDSVDCSLVPLERTPLGDYNAATRYNFANKRCLGTPRAHACPSVGNYGLNGAPAESARRQLCESFPHCHFRSGQDARGTSNTGLGDTCTYRGTVTANVPPQPVYSVSSDCVPPESLIAWWPGDGNTSDVIGDMDGIISGDVGFSAGRENQAFVFPGTDLGSVRISDPEDSPLDSLTGDFTLMAWYYGEEADGQQGGSGVEKGSIWGLGFISSTPVFSVRGLGDWTGAVRPNEEGDYSPPFEGAMLPRRTWTHYAGVASGNTLKLYKNGTLVGSTTNPSPGPRTDQYNSDVIIGWFFRGMIDNVMIFDRALSGTQIRNVSEGSCLPSN